MAYSNFPFTLDFKHDLNQKGVGFASTINTRSLAFALLFSQITFKPLRLDLTSKFPSYVSKMVSTSCNVPCLPAGCPPASYSLCGNPGPYVCQNNIPETKRCYTLSPCINIYSCHTQIMWMKQTNSSATTTDHNWRSSTMCFLSS